VKMKQLVGFCLLGLTAAQCEIGGDIGGDWEAGWKVVFGEHETLGCVVADNDQSNQYDTYDKALQRCQDIFGDAGRVVEVLNENEQAWLVDLMIRAEAIQDDPALAWWWSALFDGDDNWEWEWVNSGVARYTNWHPVATPNHTNYDCMQFTSGTANAGRWMTMTCGSTYIATRPICQLL